MSGLLAVFAYIYIVRDREELHMSNISKCISTGKAALAQGHMQAKAGMQLVNEAMQQQAQRDRIIALYQAKQNGNVIPLRRKNNG